MTKGTYLGEFEQVLLLAVARLQDRAYGVSIRDEISRRTGRESSIGAVYATLDRLRKKGFLTSEDGDPEPVRGGRAKRYFRLTDDGRTALQVSHEMLQAMWEGIHFASEGSGDPKGSRG